MNETLLYPMVALVGPPGTGKTTLVQYLRKIIPTALTIPTTFSISMTDRSIREGEKEGEHYFFRTSHIFDEHITEGKFLEYATTGSGSRYGTLCSEIDNKRSKGILLFDLDIQGGRTLKAKYGNDVLVIFIALPSELLRGRLEKRGTDTIESINLRVEKGIKELEFQDEMDAKIINIDLRESENITLLHVKNFVANHPLMNKKLSQ